MAHVVAGFAPEVCDPAADTLRAGGKRIRPLLVFCCSPPHVHDSDALIAAATAVELVHMATLVHDDLIDGATMRRGRPTVASTLGAEAAVQTGDFLFARAFSELTRVGRPDAVQALAAAALDLSQGEMAQQRAVDDLSLTEERYLARCRRKTAALFSVACRLGAMLGGAHPDVQQRLATFGEHVGLAFQIFDDILDIAGAPASTGKRRGTDLRGGTITMPVILALREEPSLAGRIRRARTSPRDRDVELLCDDLAAHPGVTQARERALAFVASAQDALLGPLDGADRSALMEIADGVVDRFS